MSDTTPPFPTLHTQRLLRREVPRCDAQFHGRAQYALLRRDWRTPA